MTRQILIIDDEEDIRDGLEFELSRKGYLVQTAESGEEALVHAAARRFEVAITDLKMPGLDGLETLRALKAIDPTIAVIIATGYASPETSAQCLERGAFGCLWKPFELADLIAMLNAALEARDSGA
jgi:DNA-binding NtrC family response regulator